MKSIGIFGSTGSVGRSTIDLIMANKNHYDVRLLTAQNNFEVLAEQAIALSADYVVIGNTHHHDALENLLSGTKTKILPDLSEAAVITCDWTMHAIVGMAGLPPLFTALENGGVHAIANKEPLVAAGPQLLQKAKKHNVKILPVDSEHNAVFQCFENDNRDHISKITLTASGGPFRTWLRTDMARATPDQAVIHPNWSMGAKISVDSATMMNKGLEIIEAAYLYNLPVDDVDVIIHPQSIIHAMVHYNDGSVLAQMGAPDMRTPIAHTLNYPARGHSTGDILDVQTLSSLDFMAVDDALFPLVKIARNAFNQGQGACITLNAANEIAVEAFLKNQCGFLDIEKIIGGTLEKYGAGTISTIDDIKICDSAARSMATEFVNKYKRGCAA